MAKPALPRIGLIWAQFSAYHVDRLEAVGRRLEGRAEVVAVEVAPKSETYAWEPSGGVRGATKHQIFPGEVFDRIGTWRRFWGQLRALAGCRHVFVGIPYSQLDIILIALILRLMRRSVIVMTASKFDDHPRLAIREWLKKQLLSVFSAALVGGCRQHDYLRYLGFRTRRVLPGYNAVSMERVRRQASAMNEGRAIAFEERSFVFVGRFVAKKNIETMLDGYAAYVRIAGRGARRLTMVGDGPLRDALSDQCAELGIAELVEFTGFLTAPQVSARLAGGLALVLVSGEEQWGLVINEALAVGLPVIASYEVGAREALLRNLVNGFLVQSGSIESIAEALVHVDCMEADWRHLSAHSLERAWLADSERFADAVELLVFPGSEPAATDHARFVDAILVESAHRRGSGDFV